MSVREVRYGFVTAARMEAAHWFFKADPGHRQIR